MTYGEHEFNHVFDGSALLQRFTFGETGATFCSRFLKSYAYTTNLENEQIVVSEFGTTGKSVTKGKLAKYGAVKPSKQLSSHGLYIMIQIMFVIILMSDTLKKKHTFFCVLYLQVR